MCACAQAKSNGISFYGKRDKTVEEKSQKHFYTRRVYKLTDEMIRFWYVEIDLESKN